MFWHRKGDRKFCMYVVDYKPVSSIQAMAYKKRNNSFRSQFGVRSVIPLAFPAPGRRSRPQPRSFRTTAGGYPPAEAGRVSGLSLLIASEWHLVGAVLKKQR